MVYFMICPHCSKIILNDLIIKTAEKINGEKISKNKLESSKKKYSIYDRYK